MCRLKIKIKIIGKKNQTFIRFILVPKNIRQKGKYKFVWVIGILEKTIFKIFSFKYL